MWCEITKEGKAKYIERYKDPMTGKQKRISITLEKDSPRNRKEAQKLLAEKMDAAIGKTGNEHLTLKAIQDIYIAEQSKQLRTSTWERNKRSLNAALRLIGEDVLIQNLTAGFIRSQLFSSEKDPITLNNYIRRIKALVRWAYQNDYVDSLKCVDKLAYFKEDNTRREKLAEKFLEKEELNALLDGMKEKRWKYLTKVLALSGMRIGELIALNRSDVDYTSHTINICKTYDSTNGILETGAKTDTSNRALYMQPELENAMRDLSAAQMSYLTAAGVRSRPMLFLSDQHGSYISYFAYRKYLRENSERILKRAITPHCLRHTHTALLAENGIPLDEISARLGHADSSITRDVYMHVTKRLEEQRRERLKSIQIL